MKSIFKYWKEHKQSLQLLTENINSWLYFEHNFLFFFISMFFLRGFTLFSRILPLFCAAYCCRRCWRERCRRASCYGPYELCNQALRVENALHPSWVWYWLIWLLIHEEQDKLSMNLCRFCAFCTAVGTKARETAPTLADKTQPKCSAAKERISSLLLKTTDDHWLDSTPAFLVRP